MTDREFDVDAAMQRLVARIEAAFSPLPDPTPIEPVRHPALRAVTAANKHEFAPAPRKRGRPRKIDARDNIVPIGSRRSAAASPIPPTRRDDVADIHPRTAVFLDAVMAHPIGATTPPNTTSRNKK